VDARWFVVVVVVVVVIPYEYPFIQFF